MKLTGYIQCLRGEERAKIAIGYEKKDVAWVSERYQFPDWMVALLKKILGSFLQNKLFDILNMALRPSACGYGTQNRDWAFAI